MIDFLGDSSAQIIGFFGLGFVILAFQLNDRSRLIKAQSISLLLYAVHFYLLGALSGAALDLLGVARNYVFVKFRNRYSFPWLPILFILLFIAAAALTWEGAVSFLPLGGMVLGAIAFWQKSTKAIRLLNLVGPVLWFIYSYINFSLGGMIGMTFIFGSIVIAIVRYDILRKPEPGILKDKLKIK